MEAISSPSFHLYTGEKGVVTSCPGNRPLRVLQALELEACVLQPFCVFRFAVA